MQATGTNGTATTANGTATTANGTAGAEAADALVDLVGWFERALEGFVAAQGRGVASLALLGVLVVGLVVVPMVSGRVRPRLAAWLRGGYTAAGADRLGRLLPTTFSGLILRTGQVGVAVAVAAAFLVIWGLLDARSAVDRALASEPDLWKAATTVLLVALAFAASGQLRRTIRGFSHRVGPVTEHQEEIALRVGQLTVFVSVGAAVLGLWGVNLGGLLVGAGFLGIVVGLAARQTLGSLIAGFVLMFSRPFTIGDWVVVGDEEGIVTDITIFNTRLENFDGEFVVIPNDRVSDRAVTNRSQKGLLRLRTDVGVDYESDPDRAADVARTAMESRDEVADNPAPQVVPKAFGDSAVVLELRYWIDHPTPPRKWRAVSAVVESVKAAFEAEGIAIPFPQRELTTRVGTGVDGADEGESEGENGEAVADVRSDGDGAEGS